nr:MAG TPA: hypothetical protein [Caudoviricetes sp.]
MYKNMCGKMLKDRIKSEYEEIFCEGILIQRFC